MSQYTPLSNHRDNLLAFLDVVWKTSPRIRSDAARFYAYEAAKAASMGLASTWSGTAYGGRWLITPAGLKRLPGSPHKKK